MARSRYIFDKHIADAAVDFFPRFLRFVEGEWAGRPLELAPWQAHHTREIFGWRRRKDGRRRYRFVRGWVPRKNGKSTWAAGLGHLLTIGDGEPGAQVYCHAIDKAQASVVFDYASRMASLSEPLSKLYEVTRTSLFCPALMAAFRPLTGEAYGKHGLSPHANIGDEVHGWKNGKLHTFLIQGMGARRQPLDLTISTAGEIKTYGHELYETTKKIIEDPTLDPETYGFIYEADKDADWSDPDVWASANPNLGISLKREFLEAECKRARQSPREENNFKRYHLNLWVEQAIRWLPMHRWSANTQYPDDLRYWEKLEQDLAGRACFGGLDLGSTSDLTCLCWLFLPHGPEDRTTLLFRFWLPSERAKERSSPRTPYDKWAREGLISTTPGNVTDYDFIEHAIREDCKKFQVKGIAIDPYNATQVSIHLADEGIPISLFHQRFAQMNAPSKEFERRFTKGVLEHGNNAVMRWMAGNAVYRMDPQGNIKPDRERAADKIDGVVSGIMALGLATAAQPPEPAYQMIFA